MRGRAKLFMHGGSQAVRLPKAFRLPGTEVRVTRVGHKVLLEPLDPTADVDAWWQAIDALGATEFLVEGVPRAEMVEPDAAIDFD